MATDTYEDLYDEHILPHFETPYHKGRLECPTCSHSAKNPLCGDVVQLDLHVDEQGKIVKAYFDGNGCAISQAAASMLCQEIEGKPIEEVEGMQAADMLKLIAVPLTATRQKCGLLAFKVLKTLVYGMQRQDGCDG